MVKKKKILFALFLLPLITFTTDAIIVHMSIWFGLQLLYGETHGVYEDIDNKKKDILLLCISVFLGFLIRVLYQFAYLDSGFFYRGINIIPTYAFLFYIIVPILYRVIIKRKTYKTKGKNNIKNGLLLLSVVVVMNILDYLGNNHNQIEFMECVHEIWSGFIIAAFTEEIFFRGFVYDSLKRILCVKWARIISALVFTLWHVNLFLALFGCFNILILYNIICVFGLGLIETYIYDKTQGLVVPILYHAINNGVVIYILKILSYLVV